MTRQHCIVTAKFTITLLAAIATSACSRYNDPFFGSANAPGLVGHLCSDLAPSPERLVQFIDTMRKQNAPFVSRAQSVQVKEHAHLLASLSSADQPIQTRSISLRLEMGDMFPTLTFPPNSVHAANLRLDPFLRRADVSNISRIAVSPDTGHVAIIVQVRSSDKTSVLIIDRTINTSKQLELAAFDLSWLENGLLLISTLTDGRPNSLYLYADDSAPRLLYANQHPRDEVLLAPHAPTKRTFIEVRSPNTSSIFSLDPANPLQLRAVLQNDLPGAGCTLWQEKYTCLSFKNNRAGEVLVFTQGRPQALTKGSLDRPIVRIDSDSSYLRLFFSTGTATALQIFASTSKPPVTVEPLGPVTTLSPATTHTHDNSSGVKARSFLSPTRTISTAELLQSAPQEVQTLDRDTITKTPYSEEALRIRSVDGVPIPVSLVRPRSVRGLLIQAYGAYGVSSHAEHSSEVLALLEKGIAVAIVHVRGGGELGPLWHTAGMGLYKSRGVDDLISATQHLQRHVDVSPQKTILRGRSAGGWLVTRAAMKSHNVFSGIILDAPLLDLEDAVSSPDAPLFHRDLAEWGNAHEARQLSTASIHTFASLPFHIFVSVPMRDILIPAAKTLSWALQAHCKQPPGYAMVLHTLPTAGHEGPTTIQDARALETLQIAFIAEIAAARVAGN
jgi:protease II